MEPEDKGRQSRWQARQGQSEDLPNFSDDLGPARSPLQELRDSPFLTPEGDVNPDEDLYGAPVEQSQERRSSSRSNRAEQRDTILTGTTLLGVIAYFAIGGIALIITGLVLGGFAGILMALVGLLSAAAAGVAGWQQFGGQRDN